jgi:hypothetical protein
MDGLPLACGKAKRRKSGLPQRDTGFFNHIVLNEHGGSETQSLNCLPMYDPVNILIALSWFFIKFGCLNCGV